MRVLTILFFALWCVGAAGLSAADAVTVLRLPAGGVQPQAVTGSDGRVHVVYLTGTASAADLWYTSLPSTGLNWSELLRVSAPGAAVAMGTVRGAHLALGRKDRVLVAWNASGSARPTGPGDAGMLYARMNDDGRGFSAQRNLVQKAGGLDGGGTIASDGSGSVLVFWHASAGAEDDAGRAVFVAKSSDDGVTFAPEMRLNREPTGACGCCGMGAAIAADGRMYALYRAAGANLRRDMMLLSAGRDGVVASTVLDGWERSVCPMSTCALLRFGGVNGAPGGMALAWETQAQIHLALARDGKAGATIPMPGAGGTRKHPALAVNSRGEILVAWTEGTAWEKGGTVAWQRFSADGSPVGERGQADDLPVWGLPAAVARPDGSFVILY